MAFLKKFWSFLKKDFLITVSYRVNLIIGFFGMFIGILKFGFMAHFLQAGNTFPTISKYGGSLISYLVTGGIFMSYVSVAMNSFRSTIRSEQSMGTLEYLLLSNTPIHQIVLFSGLSSFLWTTLDSSAIFIMVAVLFGVQMKVNLLLSLLILALTVICISGIGLMSAGIIMVTKKGDPVGWIFTTLTGLLSGVFYPVSVLPSYLRAISFVLPPTYAMHALRKALLVGASFHSVEKQIFILVAMSLVTVPAGILTFRWGFNEARRRGSLIEY